jgi:methionine-rich copper-binding protein CopC
MHMTRGRLAGPLFALVAAVTVLSSLASPAASHSELVSSAPAEGSTVEDPTAVSLVFNEALLEVGSELSVTDASGAVTLLSPTYPEPTTLAAQLPALAAGTATVTWRVVSADGHPIEGVLSFQVTNARQPEPSPSASPNASASASPQSTPSPEPSASAMPVGAPEPSGGLPAWLWLALIVAVLAAAGAAVVTSRRR